VALLEAAGHSMVYVNGVPRTGDPYSTGWTRLPIKLNRGNNGLLFLCSRGTLRIKLTEVPKGKLFILDMRDLTLPDLRVGEKLHSQGAVVVVNATETWAQKLSLHVNGSGLASKTLTVPAIPPLATRKVGFPIDGRIDGRAADDAEVVHVNLELSGHEGKSLPDRAVVDLRIRKPFQTYKRTFVSEIDGSVQYYAVNPAHPGKGVSTPPALFLSLHGASVEAIGQADAYYGKTWGDIVCPTNRRPYGFDWEDWGQMDAMEVLAIAQRTLHADPAAPI
jgi:hypothetical protein